LRHKNLLSPDNSLLIVVDIQEAFEPHIAEVERVIERSRIMAQAAQLLEVPIIVTEQYPKGLGHAVAGLRDVLGNCQIFEKTAFSCCQDDPINAAILASKRQQIILVGIEGHVCISQTAHDILAQNLQCHLAADAIGSRRQSDCDTALARLANQNAIITTTEAAIMEMVLNSRHPRFREISKLIK
jgi:isochorismate hydrolase